MMNDVSATHSFNTEHSMQLIQEISKTIKLPSPNSTYVNCKYLLIIRYLINESWDFASPRSTLFGI